MTSRRTQLRAAFVSRLGQNLTPPPAQGQPPAAPTYRVRDAQPDGHTGWLFMLHRMNTITGGTP